MSLGESRSTGWRDAPVAQFAVIGDPIEHSRSPEMHAAAFRSLGLPYRTVRVHVEPGEVDEALEHLASIGFLGVNVTVPHKEAAWRWSGRSGDGLSARIGAANTLRLATRECINTDGPGFVDTLESLPERALLLGAGGSARAIAASLEDAGVELTIWNRTRERAEALKRELDLQAEILDEPDLAGFDLIVNATSAGLHGGGPGLEWGVAKPSALAYDLVYGSTPFLEAAAARGLQTMDGIPLLVAQGARSLEWWLGVEAPRAAMLKALL